MPIVNVAYTDELSRLDSIISTQQLIFVNRDVIGLPHNHISVVMIKRLVNQLDAMYGKLREVKRGLWTARYFIPTGKAGLLTIGYRVKINLHNIEQSDLDHIIDKSYTQASYFTLTTEYTSS